jgi:hypothetical protein
MDQKMMDRVRELEKRREAGKKVPELDALYEQIDRREQKGYDAATDVDKTGVGKKLAAIAREATSRRAPSRTGFAEQLMMGTADGMAKGGMTASKRADGIAQRGKTRCKTV